MIDAIPVYQVPNWIPSCGPLGDLPLRQLLQGSVYYPSSGFDGQPVKFLAGNFHSFVYVDYGLSRDQLLDTIQGDQGFLGYEILAQRDVAEQELVPCGWQPLSIVPGDGRPPEPKVPPFSVWIVLKRRVDFDVKHGPMYFSLLYICGDGAATYQAIYLGNATSPAVLTIIQPGHGFGGNWTNFENPRLILGRSVLGDPTTAPKYLLYGGWGDGHFYTQPCWPEYSEPVCTLTGRLRLWQRQ